MMVPKREAAQRKRKTQNTLSPSELAEISPAGSYTVISQGAS